MKLIKIRGWEIRKNNAELSTSRVTSHHLKCPGPERNDISWFANEDPVCWNCRAKVPDEIQALMYLHEGMNPDYNQ